MHYEVYGPFEVDMNTKRPWKERKSRFWKNVEDEVEGLSKAIGIYVFSTRHGSIRTPWYVGKTVAKAGFRGEVFQDHKLSHYVATTKRGERSIYLIAKVTPSGDRFCKPSDRSRREVDLLETAMIGMALQANPKVRNAKKTWFLKTCRVPGLFGPTIPGRPTEAVAALRSTFGL